MAIAMHTLAPPQVREIPNIIINMAPIVKIHLLIFQKLFN
jgi:hypothetical protein